MLETRIVKGVTPLDLSPARVERELRALLDAGARIVAPGRAKERPRRLLTLGYTPKHKIRLFDTVFYLAELRQEPNARYFIAYVLLDADRDVPPGRRRLFARYLYKDASLIWRSASAFARSEDENWIGKGDLKWVEENGERAEYTAEETTNLPLEIQPALDELSRLARKPRRDERAIGLVLKQCPDGRVAPYADFTGARRRAAMDPSNLVNGGEPVAWFARPKDPSSLRFAPGYAPDFAAGMLEVSRLASRLYGGELRKYRVLSENQRIQYQLVAAPRQAWVVPPQALTTELSSYGVRTVDVVADEDLFVPAYEYHYLDDTCDPPELYSQIPEGFVGAISEVDPARADASPWLEELPVIQAFRNAIGVPRPRRNSS
jgi:hypothetical protein